MPAHPREKAIDLKQLSAEGQELDELLHALENGAADDADRPFVASGIAKCPLKPSF